MCVPCGCSKLSDKSQPVLAIMSRSQYRQTCASNIGGTLIVVSAFVLQHGVLAEWRARIGDSRRAGMLEMFGREGTQAACAVPVCAGSRKSGSAAIRRSESLQRDRLLSGC
jgi:hypothetical protein